VRGAFTSDAPFSGPNCPSPIDLCATATFTAPSVDRRRRSRPA
jgi:hypothetical protein